MIAVWVLVLVALAFSWSMGAHYTGACMGMPYASGSIGLRRALGLMAVMTLLGAGLFSHGVLERVGHGIIIGRLQIVPATLVIGTAFVLTTLFTRLRIPTSTIQILVAALAGAALALGLGVAWAAILRLAVLWVLAPLVACGLGFVFTRWFESLIGFGTSGAAWRIGQALVVVGGIASLAMGANDVSNATAVMLSVHVAGVIVAGLVGGVGLAAGVLTWGRPLLERVAFDIVKMDLKMATAAQLAQALLVLSAVGFGYFTSMNQALIGGMAGTGLARGRQTIESRVMFGIVRGWVIGPVAGFGLAYATIMVYQAIRSG